MKAVVRIPVKSLIIAEGSLELVNQVLSPVAPLPPAPPLPRHP